MNEIRPSGTKWSNVKKQRLLLIFVMATMTLTVVSISIFFLYETAFEQQRERLVEVVRSNARLIEAVARFDAVYSDDYPAGTEAATLSQIIDAHEKYQGFGRTGEFNIARKEDGKIIYIFARRHHQTSTAIIPGSAPLNSRLAEPMQLALRGESGSLVALDRRGVPVLAAYEPIAVLNLGLVAKIDLEEIRAPFYKAGLVTVGIGLTVIFIGILVFVRISDPIVEELENQAPVLMEANRRLQEEVAERRRAEAEILLSREQLRNLSRRLQEIREEEKGRISREVHDKLGQSLTVLKLDLACLKAEIPQENFPHREMIRSMMELIDETITTVQRIATELRPQVLDVFGFCEAIKWQVVEYAKRTGIEFDLSHFDATLEVGTQLAMPLFRIFQETLTNIARHSKASTTWVRFYRSDGHLVLEVEDNGVGIDVSRIDSPHSMGLSGIRERAHFLDGRADIRRGVHNGTIVTVTAPNGACHERSGKSEA